MCNAEQARKIEDVIDESLKRFVHDHLHPIIEAKVGKTLADLVEMNAIKLIDIDIVPRTVTSTIPEQKENASGANSIVFTNSIV